MQTIAEMLADAKKSDEYWEEMAMCQFTEDLCARMEEKGVSRSELARMIGKSPAWVTQMLRGGNNFTLRTMVQLSRALKGELQVNVKPEGAVSSLFYVWDVEEKQEKDNALHLEYFTEVVTNGKAGDCHDRVGLVA